MDAEDLVLANLANARKICPRIPVFATIKTFLEWFDLDLKDDLNRA